MTEVKLDTAVDPVLEALEADFEGPTVTAIGGGHGLAQALEAVQTYAGRITAIVGVADNGGSSGRLAPALDIPPPGDIRRCLLALSPERSVWTDLIDFRFEGGDVTGHSLGNLILAALTEMTGDFEEALHTVEQHLAAAGTVVPVALQPLRLEATVDGETVEGQLRIALGRGEITDIRLLPAEVAANPRAIESVAASDQIVIGPGSLYTSTIAALLAPGLIDALNASPAQLVYVCNLITQDGETLGMNGRRHLQALADRTGLRLPDAIVASTSDILIPPPLQPVAVDQVELEGLGIEVVLDDLAGVGSGVASARRGRVSVPF